MTLSRWRTSFVWEILFKKWVEFLSSTSFSWPVLNLWSSSDEWDPLNWPAVTSATFLFSRRTGFRDHDNLDWIWTMPEIYNSTLSLLFIIYTPLLHTGKVMLFFCSIPLLCLVSCTSLRIIITFENHHLPARKWLPSWFIPFWVPLQPPLSVSSFLSSPVRVPVQIVDILDNARIVFIRQRNKRENQNTTSAQLFLLRPCLPPGEPHLHSWSSSGVSPPFELQKNTAWFYRWGPEWWLVWLGIALHEGPAEEGNWMTKIGLLRW